MTGQPLDRHSDWVGRVCQGCGSALPPNKAPGRERKWCSDRCRKQTLYAGSCVDCGAPTTGSNGFKNRSERCNHCRGLYETRWTREAILAAIRRWNEEHGHPPVAAEWNTTEARQLGYPERGDDYPGQDTVQRAFGSWNAAIEAAGFEPLPMSSGRRRKVAA